MSLEQALVENTAAMRDLIAVMTKGVPLANVVSSPAATTAARPGAQTAPVKTITAVKVTVPTAKAAPVAVAAPAQDEVVISYEAVSKATLDLVAKKGKPAAMDLFTQYGIANAKALTVEQYAGFLDNVNELMVSLPDVVKA